MPSLHISFGEIIQLGTISMQGHTMCPGIVALMSSLDETVHTSTVCLGDYFNTRGEGSITRGVHY